MKKVSVLLLLLTECVVRNEPNDARITEETNELICAYEILFATELTEEEVVCMYRVSVNWGSRPYVASQNCSGDFRQGGCYFSSIRTIYINSYLTRRNELKVLKHELTHHLLFCLGQEDVNHEHPAFDLPSIRECNVLF